METIKLKISDIKPYERNAKKHDDTQIKNVMESIRQFGFVQPVVVDKNNVLIIGHCRFMAAKRLKMDEIDAVIAGNLSEEQVDKLRLLDNKLNESEWDFDLLAEDVPELDFSGFDIDWNLPELSEERNEIKEDEPPEVPEEAFSMLGDMYEIGGVHKLYCGDSTDPQSIDKLMDGTKADMVFTDPPYNIQTEGGCKGNIGKGLHKQGKEIKFIADFEPSDFLNVLPTVFKGNMNAYIFCNKELLPNYLNWCKDNGYSWNVLIWKKPSAIPIGDSHRPDIEYLLLFRKNALWNNGTDANYSRCLQYDRVKKSEENGNHPTPKPIELIANELKISSNKNSVVVDFFGGSGSTMMACEQLNRKCYMCELDPKYVDVIIQRYINFKGSDEDIFLIRNGERIPFKDVNPQSVEREAANE